MNTIAEWIADHQTKIEQAEDRKRNYRAGHLPGDIGPPQKEDKLEDALAVEDRFIADHQRAIDSLKQQS
jgi:hypothetical protein